MQRKSLALAILLATISGMRASAPAPTTAPAPVPEATTASTGTCFGEDLYRVGAGIYDVTGPAAELGMMGYAMVDQKTLGIQMRLRARAFVIHSPCNGKRVAVVTADLGQIFQSVKQAVVRKLQGTYGTLYGEENVVLSATHTHSGPGGFSHYALYNLTILGYDKQNFDAIVNGIYNSVVRAHNNLSDSTIKINSGDVLGAAFNRSSKAYDKNPGAERSRYTDNVDRGMTLLKFQQLNGVEVGSLNWYAVHATNVGNKNRLITGDNKGFASYYFEQWKGTSYGSAKTFVAAFANANEGDVSPNLWGVPDNVNDYNRARTIADKQYQKAKSLYTGANRLLTGGVDYRHAFVDFSRVSVNSRWTAGAGAKTTCKAAIGMSMLAGSTEDGPGLSFLSEGLKYDGVSWPTITLVPEDQACHKEKVIAVPTGRMSPYPWTPEVLPVQIVRIGQLAIIGVPFECTTMCGRRLRETVLANLVGKGVTDAVIAGLSNAYAGYVATREEYGLQHYEGASTHFGPYTLPAWQQEFNRISEAMRDEQTVSAGPTPRDLKDKQMTLQTGVVFDDKPLFKNFGDVITNANSSYSRGSTVKVVFWGGHPKNNLKTQSSFLYVDRNVGGTWQTVAYDWDMDTRYQWARDGIANSKVTITWTIPSSASTGTYRIRHAGHWKSGWTGSISSYTGTSRSFTVN